MSRELVAKDWETSGADWKQEPRKAAGEWSEARLRPVPPREMGMHVAILTIQSVSHCSDLFVFIISNSTGLCG